MFQVILEFPYENPKLVSNLLWRFKMKRKVVITVLFTALMVLSAMSCVTVNSPTPSTHTPLSVETEYQTKTFTLEEDEDYSFPVYVRNDEQLHIIWRTDNTESLAWFHVHTPSGKSLGFYEDEGQYANGTLEDGNCQGMSEGKTQFSPSEYDWEEGYYTIMVNKYDEDPVNVTVEYWVGSN